MWIVLAFAVASIGGVVHVATMAAVASAIGARVEEVRIFLGPSIVLRAKDPQIRVGVVPGTCYVRCLGLGDDAPIDTPGHWESLARWRRALVLLGGNAVLLTISCALLGPGVAIASAGRAYLQLAWLLVDSSRASHALASFASVGSMRVFVGALLAKQAALNLLPFSGLNGDGLVRLLVPRGRAPMFDRVCDIVSSLVPLILAIALVVALVRS